MSEKETSTKDALVARIAEQMDAAIAFKAAKGTATNDPTTQGAATPSDEEIMAWAMEHQTEAIKILRGSGFVRVSRAVLARWGAPQAVGRPLQQSDDLQQAHRLGFLRAAGWAQRDDLFADVDSPTYKKDQAEDLGRIKQLQQSEPVPITDEQIDAASDEYWFDDYLDFQSGVRFAEKHHGITSKAEGAQP